MKCLEKDRNRRYETANDLVRDIERLPKRRASPGVPTLCWLPLSKICPAKQDATGRRWSDRRSAGGGPRVIDLFVLP